MCPYLTFLICNETELIGISKLSSTDSIEDRIRVILEWGCEVVVVTFGDKGAAAYYRSAGGHDDVKYDFITRVTTTNFTSLKVSTESYTTDKNITHEEIVCLKQSAPHVVVTDTTGGGDAFTGAFLIEWIHSKSLISALKAGCISGSACCTLVGGSTTSHDALDYSRVALL